MTYINGEQYLFRLSIGQTNDSILPDITINENSITSSSTSLSGTGTISYNNESFQISATYYGDFDYYSIYAAENSIVYSAYITINKFGSYSIQNINLTVKDLGGDPNYVELLLLQNDDYITATNYVTTYMRIPE